MDDILVGALISLSTIDLVLYAVTPFDFRRTMGLVPWIPLIGGILAFSKWLRYSR